MAKTTCTIDGCERPVKTRGWCRKHYERWQRNGDPTITRASGRPANTPESFWKQTTEQGACVVWTGHTQGGYGCLKWSGKNVLAHRLAFFLRLGRWPDGGLRHLCNNPPCVLHAVEGTRSENMLDRIPAGTDPNASKTHCPQGHPYDEANTYRWRTGRYCRACIRERARVIRAARVGSH